MNFPYDRSFDPPAPVLEAIVTNTMTRRLRRKAPALLDTGADITAIPGSYETALRLYPISKIRFEDVNANVRDISTYKVRLLFAGLIIPSVEVVLTGLDLSVIGRDVLNRYELYLNGPDLGFAFKS